MKRPAGIIFDMDGVLCDSEGLMAAASCRMFAERHGVTVRPADFAPFAGTGEDRYLGGVAEKYGVTLVRPRDKDRAYAIYLELIKGNLQPLPGVKSFIATCRQRGFKLAVATSADQIKLEGNLREIGLPAEGFDATVNGSELHNKKPAPDIFLMAAERFRLLPADCLVIEDSTSGVKAAKAAGCRCLGLMSSLDAATLRDAGADWVAASLTHVPATLTSLLVGPSAGAT